MMDKRDKLLDKHMKQRMELSATLPLETQRFWANKCLNAAMNQHRIVFYLKVCIWLSNIDLVKNKE